MGQNREVHPLCSSRITIQPNCRLGCSQNWMCPYFGKIAKIVQRKWQWVKKNTRDEERNLSSEFDYRQGKISLWICSDASACGMSVKIRGLTCSWKYKLLQKGNVTRNKITAIKPSSALCCARMDKQFLYLTIYQIFFRLYFT